MKKASIRTDYGSKKAQDRGRIRNMKKPTLPKNEVYWLGVARSPDLVTEFMNRGNDRQKRELSKAVRFLKWREIQEQKEALCVQN